MDLVFELSLLFLLMIVQVIIPPIPAEVIVIAAGRQYGLLAAFVSGTGLWTGSLLVYLFGIWLRGRYDRFFGRDKVRTVMSRLQRYENLLLWVRILPYNPSDVISYGAGILRINRMKFALVTLATSLVRCLLLTYMGRTIQSWSHVFVIVSVLLLSALAANAIVLGRRNKH